MRMAVQANRLNCLTWVEERFMDNVAKTAKPHITLMGADKYGIRISRYVLKALGWPTYICFLKSEDKKSIALVSCKKEQPLSIKVPEDISTNAERKMRVYCKPFRDELIAANDLDPEKPFLVEGEYKDALNAVVFPLKVF